MKQVPFLLLSFLYFNALFTFENIPSTPALAPVAKLSIEVVALLGILALARRLSRFTKAALAVLIFLSTLVRYVDVTALGVLGREFNLHGDFPHLHRVFAMFWEAMSLSSELLVLGVVAFVTGLALTLNWIGLGAWERALEHQRFRRVVLIAVPVLGGAFLFASSGTFAGTFTVPTSAIVAKQIRNLRVGKAEERAVVAIDWPAQNVDSSLEGLGGANVFLIFLESYGVTLIEDAHHYGAIAPRYQKMERRLKSAGYSFASSQIHSPTFGGGSWRAHATLLSGFHVESEHLYNALLASDRKTLVSVLSEHGYRTVAVEPGVKWFWPDGEFYGFDRIYAFDDIDYDGPPMGWWTIPDQFTLYRFYKNEIRDARAPLFAKLSLIMSHIPYFPMPEYVEEWSRFDDGTAFDAGLKSVAHDAYSDLRELSTWYVEAFRYELDVIEGFLLSYVPENSVVIVVGDHQPPKLVTHDNDSWAVPIHVFSKREELVRAFDPLGFEEGLVPLTPTALRMADFFDGFLEIYDGRDGPLATMPATRLASP